MWTNRSRPIFEIITIIGIITFAVISLTPSTTKQQSVQLDHGRISYNGAVLKHKFDGQGTLQVNKQGRYVGHFTNGRLKAQANSSHRTGGACKATSARVR